MMEERKFIILVAADTSAIKSKPSAFDVANICLSQKKWGLGTKTGGKTGVPRSSKVLIYLAGTGGIDFECVLAKKGTGMHNEWMKHCTQVADRNPDRHYGYA